MIYLCAVFAGVRQGEGAWGGADGDTRAAPVGEGAGEGRRGGNPQLLSSTIYRSCYNVENIVFNPLRERERNAPKRSLMREKGRIVCCYFRDVYSLRVASRSDVDCGK